MDAPVTPTVVPGSKADRLRRFHAQRQRRAWWYQRVAQRRMDERDGLRAADRLYGPGLEY